MQNAQHATYWFAEVKIHTDRSHVDGGLRSTTKENLLSSNVMSFLVASWYQHKINNLFCGYFCVLSTNIQLNKI